ncbi:MAG TPA: hypothetical protein VH189_01430 [Rhizomicrobium sp.]|jgi:hypothetical protein|nr:hypothetical protein [Rhizomicrobium sp.]
MKVPAAAALLLAPSIAFAAPPLPELAGLPALTVAQSDYVEHCSGCHGMQGNSAPAQIPVLRDRVGYFMCTREGREYLIRLPNVAYSAISDNQELADMMNFVVFGLGGNSAPVAAKPFTAEEVARLRKRALATQSLIAARAEVVGKMVDRCAVPKSMNYFYDGQEQAAR